MIRPLAPFTVRPRLVESRPRRSDKMPSARCLDGDCACDGEPIRITPLRRSVRARMVRRQPELRVLD